MSRKRWAVDNLPEPLLWPLRSVYSIGKILHYEALKIGDRLKIVGPESIYKDSYYAKRRNDPWRSDAQETSRVLHSYFSPDSVIDFGCAIGAYLEPFHDKGVTVKGVEGNQAAFEYAVVPETVLTQHDLREPYDPDRSYDLVICFEVAEHLPKKFADVLVDTLVESGEQVVFTAAKPGQGGDHHVNEQPQEYWINKFEKRGMKYDGDAVEALRSSIETERTIWLTENLMVFYSAKEN